MTPGHLEQSIDLYCFSILFFHFSCIFSVVFSMLVSFSLLWELEIINFKRGNACLGSQCWQVFVHWQQQSLCCIWANGNGAHQGGGIWHRKYTYFTTLYVQYEREGGKLNHLPHSGLNIEVFNTWALGRCLSKLYSHLYNLSLTTTNEIPSLYILIFSHKEEKSIANYSIDKK